MKIEKVELVQGGWPHPHDVYWSLNLPELRLAIRVYKKKKGTKEKAERLIEYLIWALNRYHDECEDK